VSSLVESLGQLRSTVSGSARRTQGPIDTALVSTRRTSSLRPRPSLRKLGAQRWKSLQRWAYAGIVLTAAHAIAYQQIEKRISPFQVLLYIVFGMVSAFQIMAAFKSRQTG
jgi:hypothetical protein